MLYQNDRRHYCLYQRGRSVRRLVLAFAALAGLMVFADAQQVSNYPSAFPALSGDCTTSGTAITCTNLGLGSIATQAASAVSVTGGTIENTTLGATTPASVKATTIAHSGVEIDTSYSYQTPANLFSITPAAGVGRLILNPAGTLAAGTVTMPASPVDGQLLVINSSQIVSALTMSANAGQSLLGALTTIGVGGRIECLYRAANTTWYC